MNMPTRIDTSAPVQAHHEIDIRADLETVWRLQTEVDAWPTWQTDITEAHLDGALAVGGSFTWTNLDFTVTATLYTVIEHCRLLWGGTGNGVTEVHEWVFSPTAGRTHVCLRESIAGCTAEANPAGMQAAVDVSLASWLTMLKQTAERH